MGFIGWIKGIFRHMFQGEIERQFKVEPVSSSRMIAAETDWMAIYTKNPPWLDPQHNIKSINMATTVCAEMARLTTLAISIKVTGSTRATALQKQIDDALFRDFRLRKWVEYGAAAGTIIFKPNGTGVDVVTPERFRVISYDSNHKITGIVFQDSYTETRNSHYTRLEYHHTSRGTDENGNPALRYEISTRTFHSTSETDIGALCPITSTKWAGIDPDVSIDNVQDGHMLFGTFSMPSANTVDLDSPLGMALFADAIEELKDLDIAYSRNAEEIDDSASIELLDDALIQESGKKVDGSGKLRLPHYVHNVFGNGTESFYQHIDRPLKTTERKVGIDQQLSLIGYKCGFSNGYFVLDQKTGMVTATQVESDDQRTIQTVKDIRDNLRAALDDLIYALDVFADLYQTSPSGSYRVDYDFGDITYNYDEDRQRWYSMASSGKVPFWMYLVKFEGMSEEEAKAAVAETQQQEGNSLFSRANEE